MILVPLSCDPISSHRSFPVMVLIRIRYQQHHPSYRYSWTCKYMNDDHRSQPQRTRPITIRKEMATHPYSLYAISDIRTSPWTVPLSPIRQWFTTRKPYGWVGSSYPFVPNWHNDPTCWRWGSIPVSNIASCASIVHHQNHPSWNLLPIRPINHYRRVGTTISICFTANRVRCMI